MKDWLNDIHDKMGDFETEVPEGLWARLEAAGATEPGHDIVPEEAPVKRPAFLSWGRRLAAAGAAAAAVLAGVFLLKDAKPEMPATGTVPRTTETLVADAPDGLGNMVPEAGSGASAGSADAEAKAGRPVTSYSSINSGTAEVTTSGTVQADPGDTAPGFGKAPEQVTGLEAGTMDPDCEERSTAADWERLLAPERTRRKGTMGIGLRSSCSSGSSSLLAMAGSVMSAGPGDNVAWDESPALGMMLFNRGGGKAEYTHHMPLRVGLMLDWQIGGRWSVESGVSFTRLSSTARQGDESNYTRTQQKIDYIGIPLNLRYMIMDGGRFGVYASAGIEVDRCVSAGSTGSYSFTGSSGSLGTERYDDRPLQFMVNAAAGASWSLSPHMSLYAEPGLTWYADDGSSLRTIYKERPVNFSMDFGLRFTLGGR